MTRLASWFEAYAFARRRLRLSRLEAIDYADELFECPGCGEEGCGATCGLMLDELEAGIAEAEAA